MSDSPRFSIVIPTRNRADLLRDAIRSAVRQEFDDYEIIVSNNDSSDHTDVVVAEAGTGIRYVQTGKTLSMPDHWEFVLQFARGKYVTYLCDDDALAPNALSVADRALRETTTEFVISPHIPYVGSTWPDHHRRNTVMLRRFTYAYRTFDSREILREMFTCRDDVWAPRMLNSFGRRDIILETRERAGGLYWMCPDYSFASCVLTSIGSFVQVDAPLRLFGVVPQSAGASMSHTAGRAAFANFQREMGGRSLFERAPTQAAIIPNMICETLLISKERLPDDLADVELDWPAYYAESLRYIDRLESTGSDMNAERAAVLEALSREPLAVRQKVEATPRGRRRALSALFAVDGPLRRAAYSLGVVDAVRIHGDRAGFLNITECAEWLSRQRGGVRAPST